MIDKWDSAGYAAIKVAESHRNSGNSGLVGRQVERGLLDKCLKSKGAELVALYGRRRIGKTFLVREHLEPRAEVFLTVTGVKGAPMKEQVMRFQREVERLLFDNTSMPPASNWPEALALLANGVDFFIGRRHPKNLVVFLDELPWLASARSGFLPALDHIWNTRLSRHHSLKMVLCGSAASWMLENLVQAKGGLHNRITRRIHLQPFSLREAQAYLRSRQIQCTQFEYLQLYMALGGVPHYLKQLEPGRSAHQNIAETCFSTHGIMRDEYQRLFASLFHDSEEHERIVSALATKRVGLTRPEILQSTGLSSGGRFAKRLNELVQAGFVSGVPAYRAQKKNMLYRLTDEYCWFYLKWIQRAPRGVFESGGSDYWLAKRRSPSFSAWSGYAFENLCLKHAKDIQRALGILSIPCEIASWRHVAPTDDKDNRGAQVDLLFDRDDGVINLCELKFTETPFSVTKAYARELQSKVDVFETTTRTKKRTILTLVSPNGLLENSWSQGLIERVVDANAFVD